MHTATIQVARTVQPVQLVRPAEHRLGLRPLIAAVAAAVLSAGLFVLALGPGEDDSAPTTNAGPPSPLEVLAGP